MGPVDSEPQGGAPAPALAYVDADGHPTDDPAAAVGGEIAEYDAHGAPRRLTRFLLLEQRSLPHWLPVGEAAFLLWVLVALIVGWLVVGVILGLV